MKSKITKEQLIEWGMVETDHPAMPMKKVLGRNKEIGEFSIGLSLHTNTEMFVINLPDGAMIILNPLTIEDLKKMEELIYGYEPVW